MKRPRLKLLNATPAFSLVEVVLALAVVTVGMVAILGLFPQGLNSARNAIDDSFIAMIVQDTVAARKVFLQNTPANIGVAGPLDTRWFKPDGQELFVTNPVDAVSAMYKCEIRASKIPSPFQNLENTRVIVGWPWYRASDKTNSPANTSVFVTEITVY